MHAHTHTHTHSLKITQCAKDATMWGKPDADPTKRISRFLVPVPWLCTKFCNNWFAWPETNQANYLSTYQH